MLCQTVIPMCLRVLMQRGTQSRQWLYDLIREVVEVHCGFPRPAVVTTSGGSLRCDPPTLPGRPCCPEALLHVQPPVTPPTTVCLPIVERRLESRSWGHSVSSVR